jgi:histidinol-phosphate/aromatic aminotransferase/cobyric acid decarboxylase-like protein
MAGARMDTAPEVDRTVSVSALVQSVRPDTAIVFVANPGNPTGTRIPKSELLRLRNGLRDDILLVIDEAYGEFADHLETPSFDMVEGGNTIVLRTFSKAYGMAGLRVGWGLFPPEVAGQLRKVMNPNNISLVSQAAALAALNDQAYMRETCVRTVDLRDTCGDRLRGVGFSIAPSFTNFLLIDLFSADVAQSADAALRAQGVFLRPQGGAGLPQTLRMTIAETSALDAAVRVLEEWKMEQST